MMKILKTNPLAFASILVIALCTPLASQAFTYSNTLDGPQSMEMNDKRMGKKQLKMMTKRLGLSEDQIAKIQSIKVQSHAQILTLKEQGQQFKDSVKVLYDNPIFDDKAFSATYAQYQDTFAQIALVKAQTKHAIYHVLTPAQQEQWAELKTKKRGKRKGQ